jgi:hypothetical protein
MLDFTLDEHLGYIHKVGYYSRCEEHDATREETLLWRRVKELEDILQSLRPSRVTELLAKIPNSAQKVWFSIEDMELLQRHARDVIDQQSNLIKGDIPGVTSEGTTWGAMYILGEEGEQETIQMICDRTLAAGTIRFEPRPPNY